MINDHYWSYPSVAKCVRDNLCISIVNGLFDVKRLSVENCQLTCLNTGGHMKKKRDHQHKMLICHQYQMCAVIPPDMLRGISTKRAMRNHVSPVSMTTP